MKPKYIDLQVNGHGGVDLLSAKTEDEIRIVSRSLYKNGVAGYLATIITAPLEVAVKAIKLIDAVRNEPRPGEALILGIHLEGPFISLERSGVHPKEYIKTPDLNHLKSLLAAGLVRVVTIAPELDGSMELIQYLVNKDIVVSLGHSAADKTTAQKGFAFGAKTVTHLFNAMPKSTLDGLAAAAIENHDVVVQLIADGVHISDDLLESTLPKITGRFILTNDPISAAGLGSGTFPLGNLNIEVSNGVARNQEGTLAGGVGTLVESIERMRKFGISDSELLESVTNRPCQLIGLNYESILKKLK